MKGGIWHLIEIGGFKVKKFIDRDMGSYNGRFFIFCNKKNIDWKYVGSMNSVGVHWACYSTSSKDKTKLSKVREIARECSTDQITPPDDDASVQIITTDAIGVNRTNGKPVSYNWLNDTEPPNENDYSICLRITYGKFVYVTCGDLSGEYAVSGKNYYNDIESATYKKIGEVDVMNVNHHGSKYSSNTNWTTGLHPTVSVISCGKDNQFKHPHKNAVKRLNKVSDAIYLTNDCYKNATDPYPKAHIMSSDIIISVPKGGESYFVSGKNGTYNQEFKIKQNKRVPEPCIAHHN